MSYTHCDTDTISRCSTCNKCIKCYSHEFCCKQVCIPEQTCPICPTCPTCPTGLLCHSVTKNPTNPTFTLNQTSVFTTIQGLSLTFTPTNNEVCVMLTASGMTSSDGIGCICLRVLKNGNSIGGTNEEVGNEKTFEPLTRSWSSAFTKKDSVTSCVPVTYVVQYKLVFAQSTSSPLIVFNDSDCHHITLTVLE